MAYPWEGRRSTSSQFVGAVMLLAVLAGCGRATPTPAPAVQATSATPSAGDTAAPPTQAFVFKVPDDIPILPDAENVRGTQSQAEYVSHTPMKEAVAYYQDGLEAQGWQALGQPNVFGQVGSLTYGKDKQKVTVAFQFNELSSRMQVRITWSGYK